MSKVMKKMMIQPLEDPFLNGLSDYQVLQYKFNISYSIEYILEQFTLRGPQNGL